jgi:hypothetical protein
MQQSTFSFQLTPTNPAVALGFECWINDQCVFDTEHVADSVIVSGNLPDDNVETDHTLKIVLKNKLPEHTAISESGEILHDACLEIANLTFDDIELGQMVNELAVYEHDFNGTQPVTKEQFFGTIGCNGTVALKFTTPIYLWLLENM